MTQQVIDKLEVAFSFGCTDLEACAFADVSPASLYLHEKQNPAFSERKKLLKQKPILLARESVVNGVKEDYEFAFKFLERKRRKEFGPPEEKQSQQAVIIQVTSEKAANIKTLALKESDD